MADIKTPFKDAVITKIPTSPSGKADTGSEPHLPGDLPGRSGGGIPEVMRDGITAKVPSFVEVGTTFKYGTK